MNPPTDTATTHRLDSILVELALCQEDLAAVRAAGTSYWRPTPAIVLGHRTAAAALRAETVLVA